MTQPEQPTSHRGTRPALFAAARAPRSDKPDFGPSILASIDGAQRRVSRPRRAMPTQHVLWAALLAFGALAVYFGAKLADARGSTTSEQSSRTLALSIESAAAAPPAAPMPTAPQFDTPAVAAAPTVGVATIENVPAPALQTPASGGDAMRDVTTSLGNLGQVPDRTAAVAAPDPEKEVVEVKAVPRSGTKPRRAASPRGQHAANVVPKSGADSDAELLAAMLPHLRRGTPASSSPAHEQRCARLPGHAALECRATFCAGPEGIDLACPASAAAP